MSARIFLLFVTCAIVLSTCEGRKIRIGAIFDDSNSDAEIAFKYAIARANLDPSYKFRFDPIIQRIEHADSFKTGKIVCNMTLRGIAAIFGPQTITSSNIVQSISSALEIPNLQTNWDPTPEPQSSNFALNLHPHPTTLAKALAGLLTEMHWLSYTILYESDEGLERLQEVLKFHGPKSLPVTVRELGPGPDYRPLLKEIHASGESHIILDCATESIVPILTQANEVKLLEDYHSYIITSLDTHTLELGELASTKANITSLRLIDPDRPQVITAVRDWELGEMNNYEESRFKPERVSVETALIYDAVSLFAFVVSKLDEKEHIATQRVDCDNPKPWKDGLRVSNFMNRVSLNNALSGLLHFDDNRRRTEFFLQIIELSRKSWKTSGTWHPLYGINFTRTETELSSQIAENIQNKLFRVASRIEPPYLYYRRPRYEGEVLTGNARFEGYAMDLIDGISKILNFSYEFYLAPGGKIGNYDEKLKKYDGMIGEVLERRADLIVCDLTITYDRRKVIDFSMPFMTLGISIIFSKTQKEPPDLFSFMAPLSLEVWMYMATAYLGVSIALFICARMGTGDWENPHPCDPDPEELENIWGLKNCMWLMLGSLMCQGCDILPKGYSTRMISGLWWFFALIITSSYTANLAAFLTMERMGPTIDSADDLAKQTKIKYGTFNGGATFSFFRDSNFSIYQRIWTTMESTRPSVFVANNKEGVERVLKGKGGYAYFMESTSIEYEIERRCELTQVGGLLDSKGYGIGMPVNSPYRTYISGAVLKMQEEGKLQQLKTKWWKEMYIEESCNDGSDIASDDAELGMDNVGGIFMVLAGGVAIAFIISIFEFLWNVRKVAVDELISPWEAFKIELKFALNIFITRKSAKPKISDSSGSQNGSETRSIAQSMLRTAGSFLHLDIFDRK